MQKPFFNIAILALSPIAFAADFAPSLQWVKTTGGSGTTIVTGAATDARGNLYIVGSTTSLDFPTTSATQPASGGSSLVRINLPTGSATRLYPANLPPINLSAAAPSDPATLYISNGGQIYGSTDSGATWKILYQFPSGSLVSALAVDPSAASTVYAGTYTLGLQKSTDGVNNLDERQQWIPRRLQRHLRIRNIH